MKAIIIGNSGSGKTWLAERLGACGGFPVVSLDDLYWEPGGFDRKRDAAEVAALVAQSADTPAWIVEGVFGELAEQYMDTAEFMVWLDLSWATCGARLERRGSESKKHLGREQSDAGLAKLVEWASRYYDRHDLRSHQGHGQLLRRFIGESVRLTSEAEVNGLVEAAQQGAPWEALRDAARRTPVG